MPSQFEAATETLDTKPVEEFDLYATHEFNPIQDPDELEFPSSDGVAMSDSDLQFRALFNVRHFLSTHFKRRSDVYVSGNIFVYYDPHDSSQSISPGILVTLGIPRGRRRVYKTWVEGKVPDFAMDVLSFSSTRRDIEDKRDAYARLGIREFFLFDSSDSSDTLITPPLQGHRLVGEQYERLPEIGIMTVRSELLGLDLWVDEERDLRMRDMRTGINLLSPEESETGLRVAEEQAEQHRDLAKQHKERAKQYRERAKQAKRKAAKEAARAERERMRAAEEARIRHSTEARLAELESRLRSNQ